MVRFRSSLIIECFGDGKDDNRLGVISVDSKVTLRFDYLMEFDEFMVIKKKMGDLVGRVKRPK